MVSVFIGPNLAKVKLGHQGARPPVLLWGTPLFSASDSRLLLIFLCNASLSLLPQLRHFSFQPSYRSVSLSDLVSLSADLLSQGFVFVADLPLLFKSLLYLSKFLLELCRLIVHTVPLEVHQQTQALWIESVALIEDDLFEYDCKAFLLLFPLLPRILFGTSTRTRPLWTQQSANPFETLPCLAQFLLLLRRCLPACHWWRRHWDVRAQVIVDLMVLLLVQMRNSHSIKGSPGPDALWVDCEGVWWQIPALTRLTLQHLEQAALLGCSH